MRHLIRSLTLITLQALFMLTCRDAEQEHFHGGSCSPSFWCSCSRPALTIWRIYLKLLIQNNKKNQKLAFLSSNAVCIAKMKISFRTSVTKTQYCSQDSRDVKLLERDPVCSFTVELVHPNQVGNRSSKNVQPSGNAIASLPNELSTGRWRTLTKSKDPI